MTRIYEIKASCWVDLAAVSAVTISPSADGMVRLRLAIPSAEPWAVTVVPSAANAFLAAWRQVIDGVPE
jgi:dUTPase